MNHLWGYPFPKEVCHIQRDCHPLSHNAQKCCYQGNTQTMKLNHKRHFSQLSSSLLPTMNKFSIYLLIICDYSNVQILYCCLLLYYWFISYLLVKVFYKIEYCGGHGDVPLRSTSRICFLSLREHLQPSDCLETSSEVVTSSTDMKERA